MIDEREECVEQKALGRKGRELDTGFGIYPWERDTGWVGIG